MKKKNVIIISILIVILILVITLLLQRDTLKNYYEIIKARIDITNYFEAVIDEDYSKAVKYVSFFNSDNNSHIAANEQLNNEWIRKISDLAQKNIYLEEILSLDVKMVDDVITAQISLSVNDVGYSDKVDYILELNVNENAGLFDIKYQISDVTDEECRLEIEDALSGIVKE